MTILHYPFAHDGCTWYRQRLPLEGVKALGATLIEVDPKWTDQELEAAVKSADVLFVRPAKGGLAKVYAEAREINPSIAIIADTDDDLFEISPLNNAYEQMGQTEIQTEKGGWIWKHGQKGFDLRANWHRAVDYRWLLREADVVTTTTSHLAKRLEEHNDTVAIMPNAIREEDWPLLELKPSSVTRIVWAGGSSHLEDLMMVRPIFKRILEEYPNVEIHIIGQYFGAFFKGMPERLIHHRWVDPGGLGFRMACLNAQIGIAPLQDNHFNHAKSSIKFYEYSALGLATLASNTLPYSDDIEGERGVLADPQHLYEELVALIQDPIKRATLAREAREWVMKTHEMKVVAKDWLELFETTAKAVKEAHA